jgi:hypothetical protein
MTWDRNEDAASFLPSTGQPTGEKTAAVERRRPSHFLPLHQYVRSMLAVEQELYARPLPGARLAATAVQQQGEDQERGQARLRHRAILNGVSKTA